MANHLHEGDLPDGLFEGVEAVAVDSEAKGLRFLSQEAIVDTRTGKVVGQSQVQGEGPLGQLNAKSYSVEDKGDRLVFRGGVRARVEGR